MVVPEGIHVRYLQNQVLKGVCVCFGGGSGGSIQEGESEKLCHVLLK